MKKAWSLWIAGVFVVLAVVCVGIARERHVYQTTAFLMDTFVDIRFYGPKGKAAADALLKELQAFEGEISPYMPQSAIAALATQAGDGRPVPMGVRAFDLLQKAKSYSLLSAGTFDLTIAPVVLAWGVTAENPRIPSAQEIQEAVLLVNASDLILDETQHTAMLRRMGQAVDLGGIAKGEAASVALRVMEKFGIQNGYVSLGGNMAVRGRNPVDGKDFLFGVRDPRGDASDYIGTLTLREKTMATTGDYERFFERDGIRYHHVMDPQTGTPARGDLWSVSVIASDGALADFLSTALFVAGRAAVLDVMRDERFAVIAVDAQGQVFASAALEGTFKPHTDKPNYPFQFL